MTETKIFYSKPSITEVEVSYASDAARNGWGDSCYDYIRKFETAFKKHLDVKYSIATSSCTGALHMGLAGLGIGQGDEVILADTNWIASVSPIIHLGAKPIFVDILPDTWCINPKCVETAINKKTKAIIATHLYGNLCDMENLLKLGEKYNIPVIEDAAEAIGSIYHGKAAGSMGKFATFSFHGSKTITTGEGGMFVTNDSTLFDRVLSLSNHGRKIGQSKQFWPESIGFKYKMSNIQAAIGLGQIERIDELTDKKRSIFNMYKKALSKLPLKMNPQKNDTINGYWMPTMIIDSNYDFDRSDLLSIFKQNNIDSRVFFWPLSMLPMFDSVPENLISYQIFKSGINLPSYHDLSSNDINRVTNLICSYFGY